MRAPGSRSSGSASSSAGVSGGIAGPFWGSAVSASTSANVSAAATVARSTNARDATVVAAQEVCARTQQAAQALRDRRSAVIREVHQDEHVGASTRVVTNYNHMHAMTMQYYEVVQVYEVTAVPVRVDRCVFVPMAVMRFTAASARRFASVLADAAPPA